MATMAQGKSASLERLEQILPAAYGNYQLLVPALGIMVQYRIETLTQLHYVADMLDERHRKGNIAKVVGSATGLAGSATAASGVVLFPVTVGLAAPLVAGGVILAFLGTSTSFGAHVAEKVFEKVDLEKVQQAIDRDRAQVERVKELWEEFDNYCVEVINTLALADPSEESDVESLQTWVQVALEEIKSPVIVIAEAFQKLYSDVAKALSSPEGKELCEYLGETARKMIRDPIKQLQSIVSQICRHGLKVAGTIAFLALSAIAIGNLVVLIMTLVNMHQGSPSRIAAELRENYKKLEEELDNWLEAFGNLRN